MDLSKYFLSDEQTENRLSICRACDKFVEVTNMCSKCLCFLPAKTRMAPATCPEHKWLNVVVEE